MNGKKAKAIRKQSKVLLVDWIRSLLEPEEAVKINIDNYMSFMPQQTHIYVHRKMSLSAYHPKWVSKKIKQLLNIFPTLTIEDINLELVQWKANKSQG